MDILNPFICRYKQLTLVLLFQVAVLQIFASTITVTSKNDSGAGTLREAIFNANSGDIIEFSSSLTNDSIVLSSGLLLISNKNLTIKGLGADQLTISGNASQSIFEIALGYKLQLEDLTLRNGKASPSASGGAIRNYGNLIIIRCFFIDNKATQDGGAICNFGDASIYESTFSFNKSDSNGGAIFNSEGTLQIINSTISHNYAGSLGGGINNKSISSIIPITDVVSSTIAFNYAGDRGGGFANSFINYKDTVITTFSSSIIANNTCLKHYGDDIYRGLSSRCYMNSNGYNLLGNSDSSGLQGATGDIVGNSSSQIDPLIGSLDFYGGSTMTHELLCGSPALDNGDPLTQLTTDQRSLARDFNGTADIGAFESQEDLFIPHFDLGKDIDTCLGVVILYIAGRPTDSVNWLKTDKTLLLANSKSYSHITGIKDSIVGEVISEAGCRGYDTVVVSFFDNEKPLISNCPSGIISYAHNITCKAIVSWAAPTASDNCHLDTFYSNYQPGDTFTVGTHEVIYTAIDDAGEKASCSFNIVVKDSVSPVISCLSDITTINKAQLCGDTITFIPPVGIDNCTGASTQRVSGLDPGSFFNVGVTNEIYVVSDASGNTDSCHFKVIIRDVENPKINCPNDTIISNDSGMCEAILTYDLPQVEDNCSGLKLTMLSGLASGSYFPVGVTNVNYEVTDPSGNKAYCSFKVTVRDTEKPLIECPGKVESCDSIVNFNLPLYSDNCSSVNLSLLSGSPPGSAFSLGKTNNIYQLEDVAGNSAVCTFEVVVYPRPKIVLGDDTTIYFGDAVKLYVSTQDTVDFEWTPIEYLDDPYAQSPQAVPEVSISYKVKASSQYGCKTEDSIQIQVLFEILIPTAFTPGNSDGLLKNESWELKGIKRFPDCHVSIYNAWGDKIFESIGYQVAWDGGWKEKSLPTGTYYYIVDLKNGQKAFTGNVTIIR